MTHLIDSAGLNYQIFNFFLLKWFLKRKKHTFEMEFLFGFADEVD